MAEVTGLRNNALPYPVYGAPWGVVFPMLDADGDLVTGATTPDAEVSLNGNTFADCTNESTEIATNSGMYYLLLTVAEMTADVVAVIAKSATSGMKTTPIVLYPRKLVTLRSGTVGANAADGTTLQLDSGASAVDDFYNGCLIIGTLDTIVEARIISDYVGSTKVCTISPAFITVPDNNDTFVVYLPEGRQVNQANVSHWNELATVALPLVPTTAGRTLDVSAGGESGVDWANVGSPTTTLALTGTTIAVTQKVDVDTIKTNPVVNGGTITLPTNATLASTTNITAGTVTTATNVTTVNGFANDSITAAAIAPAAIDRATFAADTGLLTIRSNTAQAGSGTTITLDASASAVDSFYNNDIVLITGGTGVGQARFVSAYVGSTKVATVAAWVTNPDNTSTFAILPFDAVAGASAPTAAQVATAVWQDATAGDFTTSGSIGKSLFTSGVVPGGSGGLFISGSNAGTTTLGALTVTGATTHTGNVVLSDGLTISAPSTTNRAGITVSGNGTGAALSATGGATGQGFLIVGGGTSGDGIKITTTSGHGLNLAPAGSSKHGILSTGGDAGTSDGIKGAAGTGGVDLRANMTGNITGTLATLTTYTGNTPQTGDSYARLGAPAGASVSADIAAVKVDTAAVKVQTDKLTFTVANQVDSNVKSNAGTAITSASGIQEVKVASIAANAITATAIAADAITAAKIADGAIDAATFAAGAIDATAIAADAIGSSELAATAVNEIRDAILSDSTSFAGASIAAIKAKTDSLTFTVANVIDSNMLRTNGDATAAANVAKTTRAIARGTVGVASTTTSIVTSAFAPAGSAADQFKGRIVTFDADTTTAALRGQSTDITASSNVATPVLTVTALTTAPVSGDSFSVT